MTTDAELPNVPLSVLARDAVADIDLAGLKGWLLSTLDGRWLAGDLESDKGAAAAVLASAYSLSARTGELLGDGAVHAQLVHTADGIIASRRVRNDATLTLMVNDDSNMAQVLHGIRRAAELMADGVVHPGHPVNEEELQTRDKDQQPAQPQPLFAAS